MYWNTSPFENGVVFTGWIVTLDVLKLYLIRNRGIVYAGWIVTLDVLK